MKHAFTVAVICATALAATYLYLTPYRYAKGVEGVTVRIHRITGHTEVLYPRNGEFRWRTAR